MAAELNSSRSERNKSRQFVALFKTLAKTDKSIMNLSMPCDCGRTIEVSPSQCGTTLRCSCGKSSQVPNFRDLKRVQPAATNLNQDSPSFQVEANSSATETNLNDTLVVARCQAYLIYTLAFMVTFNVSMILLNLIIPGAIEQLYPWLKTIGWVITFLIAGLNLRILCALKQYLPAVVVTPMTFIPLLLLAASLVTTLLASQQIRKVGYRIGFFGISEKDLKALMERAAKEA